MDVVPLHRDLLVRVEAHRVNSVRVAEECVQGRISFNILPSGALPSAGDELHGSVGGLVHILAIEIVAVEAVIRRVEVTVGNGVAAAGLSFMVDFRAN